MIFPIIVAIALTNMVAATDGPDTNNFHKENSEKVRTDLRNNAIKVAASLGAETVLVGAMAATGRLKPRVMSGIAKRAASQLDQHLNQLSSLPSGSRQDLRIKTPYSINNHLDTLPIIPATSDHSTDLKLKSSIDINAALQQKQLALNTDYTGKLTSFSNVPVVHTEPVKINPIVME